ncbi:unnamed protein product [Blepharisma stoltei]|uniref:Uncharacterized protein n=1 Tax=Blepharisma stoltei TaxID=1481888 RepID=A0AAU9IT48_9CILI|nr:unnamed protein product [Blepharisma stoltei]
MKVNFGLGSIKTLISNYQKPKSDRENSNSEITNANMQKLSKHGRSQSVEKILFKRRIHSIENSDRDLSSRYHISYKTQSNFKSLDIPLKQLLRSSSTELKPSVEIAMVFNKAQEIVKSENCDNPFEKIKIILKLFDLIINEDKCYKNEMMLIREEINKAIFANKREIQTEILEQSLDKHWDILKDLTEEIPYFYIYDIAVKSSEEKRKIMKQNKLKGRIIKENFEKSLKEKDAVINNLKGEIEILIGKLEKLEYEAKEFLGERIALENQLSRAFKKINDLNSALESQEDIISEYDKIKYELQETLKKTQIFSNEMETKLFTLQQQNREIKFQYDSLSDSFKTCLLKLKIAYKENQDFEAIISNLELQNSELYIRAAAGFEELTPRPDLSEAFEEVEIEMPKATTQDKVQILCTYIKKYKEKTFDSPKKKGRSTPNKKHKRRPSNLSSIGEDIKKSVLDSSRISSNNS